MTAKPIQITSVCRTTGSGESDTLDLKPGVNAVVGLKDTGKSGWLQTISYLLGDTDPPEKALGQPLSEKFDTATLQMTVGGEPVTLQRRWKEHGRHLSPRRFDGSTSSFRPLKSVRTPCSSTVRS